jgi:peptide/nickel transport system permease protein
MNSVNPPIKLSRATYFRKSVEASLSAVYKAFNTNKISWVGLALFVTMILLALFAPLLAPYDPLKQDLGNVLQSPSFQHWMGTDGFGRDTFSRVLYGARISLFIANVSIGAALIIGTLIGLISGYVGGRFDIIVMQAMDVLLAFPTLILGLIIVAMLGPSVTNLAMAIAIAAIPPFARIARAPTIVVKDREFIDAGRALGFSNRRLIFRHILPNIAPEILVMGSLWLATAIRVEASLAFVGLGVSPPTPTWGVMIREGFDVILDSAWLAIFPSLAILIVVFGLNLLGDGLRDAVDPRLKGEK